MRDYRQEFNMTDNEAMKKLDTLEEYFNVDEFTFESLSSTMLLYSELLKCILVHESETQDNELDKKALINLEIAVAELETVASRIFIADEYFRQYKFEAFENHVLERLTVESRDK